MSGLLGLLLLGLAIGLAEQGQSGWALASASGSVVCALVSFITQQGSD